MRLSVIVFPVAKDFNFPSLVNAYFEEITSASSGIEALIFLGSSTLLLVIEDELC